MRVRHPLTRALILTLLCCASGPAGAARADFIYAVTVDTSALSGTNGYLDLQFIPGGTAKSASVVVQSFVTDGARLNSPLDAISGDVTGTLPGPLTMQNDQFFNDAFQGYTFGTNFTFQVVLSGPAVNSPDPTNFPAGTSFAVSLYDSAGTTPLLTHVENGSVLTINLNANGTPDITTSAPVVTVTPVTTTPVPPTFALVLSAVPAGLVLWLRARRRKCCPVS